MLLRALGYYISLRPRDYLSHQVYTSVNSTCYFNLLIKCLGVVGQAFCFTDEQTEKELQNVLLEVPSTDRHVLVQTATEWLAINMPTRKVVASMRNQQNVFIVMTELKK